MEVNEKITRQDEREKAIKGERERIEREVMNTDWSTFDTPYSVLKEVLTIVRGDKLNQGEGK
jgi:hypothetical protein